MPQALGPLALAIFQAGGPLWLSNALVGVGALGGLFGAVGQIALSFGLSALAGIIFRPKQQATKSDDVQQSLRVAISDRVKIYGVMQASGNWVFGDSKNGDLHKVLAIAQGKLVQVLGFKIDDNPVTVDNGGWVQEAPYFDSDGARCRILYRPGRVIEDYYPELAAVFPEYTPAHRGDGVVTLYALQRAVEADEMTKIFPNFKDTLYRITGRFTEIYNPVTGVTAWSDNAAGVIRDFMLSPDGMRLPASIVNTPNAIAAWKTAWNKAAQGITLKDGINEEPRYRLWGAYKLSETPGSVLEAMLANCDGRPILTRDGGIAIDITEYYEPTVLLDKSVITAVTSITRGVDVRNRANIVTAKYLSPADDYQQVDADPWIDEASVSAIGAMTDDTTFGWTPTHSQCRRLMKRRAYQLNPEWQLTVNCRLAALAAFQERFVAVDYTIGVTRIQGAFEVIKFTWNIGENGILQSVAISLRSIDPEAFAWDASQEEGSAPVTVKPDVDRSIPLVTGFDATVARRTISDQLVAYAVLDFDQPPSSSLRVQLQGKKVSESNWTEINVPAGALSVDGPLMDDGVQYEFRAWHQTLTARNGPWTDPTLKLTATADTTAPGVVTNATAAGGAGKATIGYKTPNSANFSRAHIYRNTVNNFGTATKVSTVYGSPNTSYSVDVTGLTAGTSYFWVVAANVSDVPSAAVATTPASVTIT